MEALFRNEREQTENCEISFENKTLSKYLIPYRESCAIGWNVASCLETRWFKFMMVPWSAVAGGSAESGTWDDGSLARGSWNFVAGFALPEKCLPPWELVAVSY